MDNTLKYKGYFGSVEISSEDDLFFGNLLFIKGLVTYEARTAKELRKEFKLAVDDYLIFCEKTNQKPEKPCKGSFSIRIGEELHLAAAVIAHNHALSLNDLVKKAVFEKVQAMQ